MKVFIKNMVCDRCIVAVSNIFQEAGFPEAVVQLGSASVVEDIPVEKLEFIEGQLKKSGFETLNDAKSRIIEHIKNCLVDLIYNHPTDIKATYSGYLSDQLHHDYNYLSTLFSSVEGITIEKYMINLKTERVKELLVYDEKTLSEIALELGYSSVAHLSGQFKKVTGFTPSYFKNLRSQKRKPIDQI